MPRADGKRSLVAVSAATNAASTSASCAAAMGSADDAISASMTSRGESGSDLMSGK